MASSAALRPPADAADAGLRTLWEWMTVQGVSHNLLWPEHCPRTGRGMRLTSTAAKGSVLLSIPPAALFTTSSLLTDPQLGPLLKGAVMAGVRVGPLATLCFGLLHARHLASTEAIPAPQLDFQACSDRLLAFPGGAEPLVLLFEIFPRRDGRCSAVY